MSSCVLCYLVTRFQCHAIIVKRLPVFGNSCHIGVGLTGNNNILYLSCVSDIDPNTY